MVQSTIAVYVQLQNSVVQSMPGEATLQDELIFTPHELRPNVASPPQLQKRYARNKDETVEK
jgi:hypothetical protein